MTIMRPRAYRLISEEVSGFPNGLRDGGFRQASPGSVSKIPEVFSEGANGDWSDVQLRGRGGSLAGRSPGAVYNFAGTRAYALVLIIDPESEPELQPSTLRRLYGLTKSEAVVAMRILRGKGLQSVADELSLSLSTVRIHLQRVFDKTGTHRQAELVRLLLMVQNGIGHRDAL